MDTEPIQPELLDKPGRRHPVWRRACGTVGAAILASGLALYAPGGENVPSDDNVVLAEQLLTSPSPVNVSAIELSTWPKYGTPTRPQEERGEYLANQAVAEHYGLTVHDARPYITKLEDDLTRGDGPQLPFETYFSQAQSFFKEYGVDLHLLNNEDLRAKGERRPGPTELNQPCLVSYGRKQCARKDIVEMMRALSGLPQEYVDLIELKHAVYAIGADDTAAYAVAKRDTLHFEVGALGSVTVFLHEAGHLLAYKEEAGGADDRVLVTSVKGKMRYDHGVPYGAEDNPARTYGAYQTASSKSKINAAYQTALETQNMAEACRIDRQREVLGKKVRFSDNYGATSSVEHAAQLNANLTNVYNDEMSGVDGNYFSHQTPILREQAIGNLARLYSLSPEIASYMIIRKGTNRMRDPVSGCVKLKLQEEGRLPKRPPVILPGA